VCVCVCVEGAGEQDEATIRVHIADIGTLFSVLSTPTTNTS